MIKWKDITSYSQGGDKTPHWWQAELKCSGSGKQNYPEDEDKNCNGCGGTDDQTCDSCSGTGCEPK